MDTRKLARNSWKRKFTLKKEVQKVLLHIVKNFGPCGQLSSAKHLEIYLINIVNKAAIATVSCNKRKQRKKIENYHFKDCTSLLGHTKLAFAYTDNLTNIYSEILQ